MTSPVEIAFTELCDAAIRFAQNVGEESATSDLCDKADAYARARWSAKTGSRGRADGKPSTSTMVLPLGRSRGMTIGAAPSGDLKWLRDEYLPDALSDERKARYSSANRALLDAVEAELRNRGEL